jgi:hypothetical protein
LQSYWHFYGCRYEKTSGTCYSLYLFIRDVADGDLVGWIDDRLDQANDHGQREPLAKVQTALIDPLRNVYGISDKALALGLSDILMYAVRTFRTFGWQFKRVSGSSGLVQAAIAC